MEPCCNWRVSGRGSGRGQGWGQALGWRTGTRRCRHEELTTRREGEQVLAHTGMGARHQGDKWGGDGWQEARCRWARGCLITPTASPILAPPAPAPKNYI